MTSPTDTEVVIATNVTVLCVARGVYQPTVTWRKGPETLNSSSGLTVSERTEANNSVVHSSLLISVFTRSDAGRYSCDVDNTIRNDSTSFELILLGKFYILLMNVNLRMCFIFTEPAIIISYPQDVNALAGVSLMLTCVGYGTPMPVLRWQTSRKILGNDSRTQISEGNISTSSTTFVTSLLLLCNTSEDDIGNYSCAANNTVATSLSDEFHVSVQRML